MSWTYAYVHSGPNKGHWVAETDLPTGIEDLACATILTVAKRKLPNLENAGPDTIRRAIEAWWWG